MTRFLARPLLAAALVVGFALPASAQVDQELAMKYSLSSTAFKTGDFPTAVRYIKEVLEMNPTFGLASGPSDINFRRLRQSYDSLASRATDPAQKRAYLDSALAVFDMQEPVLAEAGVEVDPFTTALAKGLFLQQNAESFPDRQDEVFGLYYRAYELNPEALEDYYLVYLAGQRAQRAVASGDPAEKAAARELVDATYALVDEADQKAYIDENVRPMLISTPREEYAYLKGRYEGGDQSEATVTRLFDLARAVASASDSTGNGTAAEARTLVDRLIPLIVEMNPTPAIYRSLAQAEIAKGDYDRAIGYYREALALAGSNEEKRDLYYNMAAARSAQGQAGAASNFAREALELDPNHGPSLYIIANGVAACIGRPSSVEGRAAYWLAADYYNRAAAAGAEGAASQAASMLRAAPASDEYFFKGWQRGQSISVNYGCGTGTTTVR